MKRTIPLLICLALLLGAGAWAYAAQRKADDAQQVLSSAAQQRWAEAQEQLASITVKLSKLPAAASLKTQVELLTGVSRQADGVVISLSALPLSHAAIGDTVKFCNQLGEYTLGLSLYAASGARLDDMALAKLSELQRQCALLSGQLATADAGGLTLLSHSVFYAPAEAGERPLEAVADADHGMDYPSMIYDGAFSDARHAGTPKALGKGEITQEQAIANAVAFVGEHRVDEAEAGVPSGGVIPCHGVTLRLHDGTVLNADVTVQGGQMLWIMPEHASFSAGLTLEECTQSARDFLKSRGYGDVQSTHYQVYGGMAVINFVAVQDGALLYPDLVKVQIRMDTGELVGLEANNYLMNHTIRPNLAPALTQKEAQAKVSPQLTITHASLCVIPERGGERLCWEFAGWWKENEYRVYIDALTGEEADVLMLIRSPQGEMAA